MVGRCACLAVTIAVSAMLITMLTASTATAQVIPRIDALGTDVQISNGLRDLGEAPGKDSNRVDRLILDLHAALLAQAGWIRNQQQPSLLAHQASFHITRTKALWDVTANGWLADGYEHAFSAQAYYRIPWARESCAVQMFAGTNAATASFQSTTLPFRHAGWIGASASTPNFYRPIVSIFSSRWSARFDMRLLLSAQTYRSLGQDDPAGTPRAKSQYSAVLPLPVRRLFTGGVMFGHTLLRDTRLARWNQESSAIFEYQPKSSHAYVFGRLDVAWQPTGGRQWTESIAATLPLWVYREKKRR